MKSLFSLLAVAGLVSVASAEETKTADAAASTAQQKAGEGHQEGAAASGQPQTDAAKKVEEKGKTQSAGSQASK